VQQGNDKPLIGTEPGEQFVQQLMRGGFLFGGQIALSASELMHQCLLFLAQITEAQFGADGFMFKLLDAGINRNSGYPVLQRHHPRKLMKFCKYFQEYHLDQVFFTGAPGQMAPNRFQDRRIKAIHQRTGRFFVPFLDSADPRRVIQQRTISFGSGNGIGTGLPIAAESCGRCAGPAKTFPHKSLRAGWEGGDSHSMRVHPSMRSGLRKPAQNFPDQL
jgi:hypothetical protein